MNKQILKLAIPNIISNLSVPLLSSVDTAILGHFSEVYYLGAIALAGVIFNFIYSGFGFLRMGTTGLTAQAYGNKDENETLLILTRTILIALVSGIVLILLQKIIGGVGFNLLNSTPEVKKFASQYFYIRIYAAPATLAIYAFHGWFLGMQNARYPLYLTVFVNGANVGFNLLFIYSFGMKSDGVAYGTVLAQYMGLVIAFILFFRKYHPHTISHIRSRIFESTALKKIFKVNFDIFIRTVSLIFTFSYFTARSADSGDLVLAANTILFQLILILAYGIDGFAFAAESLVGKFIGANDSVELKRTIKYSFGWGMGFAVIFAIVFAVFNKQILLIFTSNQTVIELSHEYVIWIVIAPFTNSFCFIWDGIFIGATATKAMRNSMLFCAFAIFLPSVLIFSKYYGNHGLWLGLTIFMITRGITLTIYSKKQIYSFHSVVGNR